MIHKFSRTDPQRLCWFIHILTPQSEVNLVKQTAAHRGFVTSLLHQFLSHLLFYLISSVLSGALRKPQHVSLSLLLWFSPGTRCHKKVPAGWDNCPHGDWRQRQYCPGHFHQMWHPATWRGLPMYGGQRVQPTDPQWTGRGQTTTDWTRRPQWLQSFVNLTLKSFFLTISFE